VQLNLALVGLLNVSLALEDPFDNQGLDGIYVDEALFEAEQVCIFTLLLCLSCKMTNLTPIRYLIAQKCMLCSLIPSLRSLHVPDSCWHVSA